MNSKNVMHVKLEFIEAKEDKKQILYLESQVLQMLTAIKKYRELREQELKNKQKINTTLKKASKNLKGLKKIIPKIETSKIPLKEEEKTPKIPATLTNRKSDIELQIQAIQKRLATIDQKF